MEQQKKSNEENQKDKKKKLAKKIKEKKMAPAKRKLNYAHNVHDQEEIKRHLEEIMQILNIPGIEGPSSEEMSQYAEMKAEGKNKSVKTQVLVNQNIQRLDTIKERLSK